jgi:flagella basal body P-ring formation protein FlgA
MDFLKKAGRTLAASAALSLATSQSGAAAQVRAADLAAGIEAELAAVGMQPGAIITLDNADLAIRSSSPNPAEFVAAEYDPASGRFVLRIAGVEAPITGVARAALRVPVLARNVARGDVIAAEDIAWAVVDEMPVGAVQSEHDLAGAEARRALSAGKAVRRSDLTAPMMVRRGAVASMIYAAPGLRLNHAVLAQEDGARGDVVDVKNPSSGRVMKALVIAESEVAPLSAGRAVLERR